MTALFYRAAWLKTYLLLMAGLMTAYAAAAVVGGYWGQLPFIVLFLSGYAVLGVPALRRRAVPDAPHQVASEEREEGQPQSRPRSGRLQPLATLLVRPKPEIADECEAA